MKCPECDGFGVVADGDGFQARCIGCSGYGDIPDPPPPPDPLRLRGTAMAHIPAGSYVDIEIDPKTGVIRVRPASD